MINNDSNDPDEKFIREVKEKLKNPKKLNSKQPTLNQPNSLDWKNENEVKTYLDNLETEYTFSCIGDKNPG